MHRLTTKHTKQREEIIPKKRIIIHKSSLPGKWIYKFIRFLHLLSSMAVFPLAIYYVKYDAGGFRDHNLFILAFMWIGALCFPVLHLFIEQYTYPTKLSGAFIFTGVFSLNFVSGLSLSDFISTYSAYQVLMNSLIVQILSLSAGGLYGYLMQSQGKQFFSVKVGNEILMLFSFYIFTLCMLLYFFIHPLINQFKQETNKYLLLFALLSFLLHIYTSTRALWSTYMNKNKPIGA
jgi:hypothetical protein